jgi:hypothetical protein
MPIPSQPTTNISLGPRLSPTNRSISSEFGDPSPHVISEFYRGGSRVPSDPVNAGVPTSGTIRFSQFNGASGAVVAVPIRYTISGPIQNLNLFNYASSPQRPASQNISQGVDQEKRYSANQPGINIEFLINSGVVVGSATTAQNALVTGTNGASAWHPSVGLVVKNQGYIVGAGGNGGILGPSVEGAGGSGGTAIVAQRAITVQNQGTIGGGGGGGGAGVPYTETALGLNITFPGTPGGGGAGQNVGTGGGPLAGGPPPANLTQGAESTVPLNQQARRGGFGGPLGVAGSPGPLVGVFPEQVGGAAGYYAKGNANITWQQNGTRQGQVQPTV